MTLYINANRAFESNYKLISELGVKRNDNRFLLNVGFIILDPMDNIITNKDRNWNHSYAEKEFEWYLSANPNGEEIAKHAKIWLNHMDENKEIRSNYGWQWSRNNQLQKVIQKLKDDPSTRQAVLTFYDGKEIDTYQYDTPCTLSVHFQIVDNKLHMTVNMRSNDLWYGFCNDQYCFSKLQMLIANELNVSAGYYYHFASNLHLYNNKLNKLEII